MSYNYAAHHRTQPPPDAEFPYWLAQPHSFHGAVQQWQQTYQFGVPLWEEPTMHSQPPRPNTQPWQQPPDLPDWQHNPLPQQLASEEQDCQSFGGRTEHHVFPAGGNGPGAVVGRRITAPGPN